MRGIRLQKGILYGSLNEGIATAVRDIYVLVLVL